MLYLTIKTDQSESEIGLMNPILIKSFNWIANRTLSHTLNSKIKDLLDNSKFTLDQLNGIIFFSGPGSFTSLRIGASVANTLAYSLKIPIIAVSGDDWKELGIKKLNQGKNDFIVVPEYGSEVRITKARK